MDKKEKNALIGNNEIILNNIKSIENKRNYGIDLLKIISTISVIILHINKYSQLIKLPPYTSKYKKSWYLEIFFYWGVNGFGLISGFVSYKRFKFSNIIYIWIEVFFYSILIATFLFLTHQISKNQLYLSFFPLLNKRNWYVNAYFSMYLFLPFIVEGIKNCKRKIFRIIIILFFIYFSLYNIIARIIKKESYHFLYNGYSPTWLTILYIIGAYFGKNVINLENKEKCIYYIFCVMIYFLCSFLTLRIYLKKKNILKIIPNNLFVEYISPSIIIQAISLLMFFSKLPIKKNMIKKIISFFSSLNFSAILIHGRLFQTNSLITKRWFYRIKNINDSFLILKIILIAIFVYIICILIDYFRSLLFKILKIRYFCELIEKKI